MEPPVSAPSSDSAAGYRGGSTVAENFAGAGWMIVSCLGATGLTVGVKSLSAVIEPPMIAFLRCLLGLWFLAPMLMDGSLLRLRITRPWMHILRGLLMGAALNCGFYAISTLEMTTATLLFFLAPVFATILAGPLLGQRVGAPRWAAVGAAFLGALLVLRPSGASFEWGMLAALASAAFFSISLMLSRVIGREDGPRSVMTTSTVVAALVCLPAALPVWQMPDTPALWGWAALLVLASSLRMYADIEAYAKGEAAFVAPFSYLRLLFIGVAGWLMFSEIPDQYEALGGLVILAAGFFIAYRERKLGLTVSGGAA